MSGILAIETSTDACSVATVIDGKINERYELAPRQHNQILFGMLDDLLPHGNLAQQGIAAIAYGAGPGSFTGLRIAASAVQGLAFACNLPAIAVSTLAVLAQGALRQGLVNETSSVLCTLDARINEVYAAVFGFQDGLAYCTQGPWVCSPADLPVTPTEGLQVVGSGGSFSDQFPDSLRDCMVTNNTQLMPAAQDVIPLALAKLDAGEIQEAAAAQPVYLRDEISWKKLSEQGKRG